MTFIRSLLLYIFNALLSFTTVVLILLVYPFSQIKAPFALAAWWGRNSARQGRIFCGMKYEIIGKENIPNEPVVFMVKHQSAWETTALSGILPPICFVVKAELLKLPIYGWGIRLLRYIPIQREASVKAFKQVLQEGKDRIQRGLSIVVFPEGTRVRPGEHPEFHKSGASLAKSARAKIVPIALNTGSVWRRNSFGKKPGLIKVVIGKPIETQGQSVDAVNEAVYDWMKTTMEKIQPSN